MAGLRVLFDSVFLDRSKVYRDLIPLPDGEGAFDLRWSAVAFSQARSCRANSPEIQGGHDALEDYRAPNPTAN